jgi:hypothetical protein
MWDRIWEKVRRLLQPGALTEEDVAAAKKTIMGSVVAGILFFLAKPLAAWFASGGSTSDWNQAVSQYIKVPDQVKNAVGLVMDLIGYLGMAILVIGIIYGGIRWATAESIEEKFKSARVTILLVSLGLTMILLP